MDSPRSALVEKKVVRLKWVRTKTAMLVGGMVLLALSAVGEAFKVDFSREVGSVRRLNGVCNAPPIAYTQAGGIDKLIAELEVPFYRFHDAVLGNPGYQLVDVSRIFPLFHLDADDPKNYNFGPTDDYLRFCVEQGAEIDFRLGESIEHARKNYTAVPPPDCEKWAEICAHIVRHYNRGWANGHRWNIRYWSVWEEPDNQELFRSGKDAYEKEYLPLYAATARRLKREFPEIKVGGPNCMGAGRNLERFVDYCAQEKLPLDFVFWTGYQRDPESYFNDAAKVRQLVDGKGYPQAEIGVSEWHFGPVSWSGHGCVNGRRHAVEWKRALTGLESGVFTAAVLMRMQDSVIDKMAFYEMMSSTWGLVDADKLPLPSYWALKAFAALVRDGRRVEASSRPGAGWNLMAAKGRDGKGHVLVSAFKTDGAPRLRIHGGMRPVSVKALDAIRELESVDGWTWDAASETFRIDRDCGESGLWLVDLEPEMSK